MGQGESSYWAGLEKVFDKKNVTPWLEKGVGPWSKVKGKKNQDPFNQGRPEKGRYMSKKTSEGGESRERGKKRLETQRVEKAKRKEQKYGKNGAKGCRGERVVSSCCSGGGGKKKTGKKDQ